MSKIHATAIVEDGVELGTDVEVGPYSIIRRGAKIGAGTRIHSHVNIWGESVIGERNEFYPYCIVGAPPQIIGDEHPEGRAHIGNKNIFREGAQVHRGSKKDKLLTRIGDENYIMSLVHIGHDCTLGNKIVIASYAGLAGHSTIEDNAVVSGAAGISQFVRVGAFSFCAGHSRVEKDLPPFMCTKEFSEVTGPNLVGMKRSGFSEDDIRVVKEIYKTLYVSKGLYAEQMKSLEERFTGHPIFERLKTFAANSKRGLMRNS